MNNKSLNSPAMVYQQVGKQSEIQGASPHKLIELLLDGAIKNISLAKNAMQQNDIEARGRGINNSIDIVTELRNSLDLDKGGEIAENLNRLYTYIEQTLLDSHINTDTKSLEIVSDLIADLLETWKQIKGQSLVSE